MPQLFYNPYHFVPLGTMPPPETVPLTEFSEPEPNRKSPHLTHDRSVPAKHSGRFVCKINVETPLLCGNEQRERSGQTKLIQQYELTPGVPALPGSALRGMLSSISEAVSHSALRVLKGDFMSYRRDMSDPKKMSALGVLEEDPGGGLCLRPLALPTLDLAGAAYHCPDIYRGLFPSPNFKVYLGSGFTSYNAATYRDKNGQPLRNFSEDGGATQNFYGMRLSTAVTTWGANIPSSQSWQRYPTKKAGQHPNFTRVPNPLFLIGQQHSAPEIVPWSEELATQGYVRGIFRGLGLWTPERKDDRPKTKYHELFIPYTSAMESWPTVPIHLSALERFHELAAQCRDTDKNLPYEPLGTRPGRNGADLQLKVGDVVYFRPERIDGSMQVAELSFSSVWRGRIEQGTGDSIQGVNTTAFFRADAQTNDLVPLSPGRTLLTLAEQLFGVVEVRDKKQEMALKQTPAFALASRLRVSTATLHTVPPQGHYQPSAELLTPAQSRLLSGPHSLPQIPLKNLASPKVPSPALYFKPKNAAPPFIRKALLNPADHVPQGRKFYLRRPDPTTVQGNNLFVHPDRFNDPKDRKSILNQNQSVDNFVRPGTVFYFTIDFENLSELELQLLAYTLEPISQFRHQLGHGKPLGLGQIQIQIAGLLTVNRTLRYTADDLHSPVRYHHAWIGAAPVNTWPAVLQRGLPSETKSLAEKSATLNADFKQWAQDHGLSQVLQALELVGNPQAVRKEYPVHYPQAALGDHDIPIEPGTARFEKELFKWFVQNDRLKNSNQALLPLTNRTTLPTLDRTPPTPTQAPRHGPPHGGNPNAPRRPLPPPVAPPAIGPGSLKGQTVTATVGPTDAKGRTKFMVPFENRKMDGFLSDTGKRKFASSPTPEGDPIPVIVIGFNGTYQLDLP